MAGLLSKLGWKIYGGVFGAITTLVARKLINAVWVKAKGGPPPANPEQRDVSWGEALTWTMASAAGLAVSRTVATRIAAERWERKTGELPPGFEVPPDAGERA